MPYPISELLSLFKSSAGVSIDTRSLEPGQIFFALKGENFDGNRYALQALEKGASAAVVDDPNLAGKDNNIIVVPDVLSALQQLAADYRDTLSCPVLAITGSNGKTTTKELIHAVLSQRYNVYATRGNLNNHIGVPLTLLSTPENCEILVVEMGANKMGDIKELCEIAKPDYGLITNVGQAHLEGFGSFEGVIQTKTELYRYIVSMGQGVFYDEADDILTKHLPTGIKAISYVEHLEFSMKGMHLSFSYGDKGPLHETLLTGEYNQPNIRAALTLGQFFEVPSVDSCTAISEYEPKMNRSQVVSMPPFELILDAYNANPTSMNAAIRSFKRLKVDKPKNLVLGDMKELGEGSVALHAEILDRLIPEDWHAIVVVGNHFCQAARQMPLESKMYEDMHALTEDQTFLRTLLAGGVTLVKASRSLRLESIRDLLSVSS